MPKKLFISVYAIAKNEELVAERWYNCFKEADEVCVLVNNSTDGTAKILRSLGAKVKEKKYSHFRFDVARNDAMKMCSSKADLLFACDMDDMIENGWRGKLEKAWQLGKATGKDPNSIIYTYSVEYNNAWRVQRQPFLRHGIHTPKGWYWKSRIHEYLENDSFKRFLYYPKFTLTSRPTKCEHSSYLPLLIEEVSQPGCDARNIHLLGREYMINGRYEEAVESFLKYLAHRGATWNSERAATMRFLSDCYFKLGFPNAQELWLWKAMAENPQDRDAPFALGKLLINKKEYRTAVPVLEKCVAIEKPELDFPFFSLDAWTEMPWLCLGEARFYIGDMPGAEIAISKGLEINPSNTIGLTMMKDILAFKQKGLRPNMPPPETPRERIEIPELM